MALVLDDVRLRWDDFTLQADLRLPEGSLTAVIGPSGAGKSTLLSAVAGFAPKAQGRIRWKGQDIADLPPWRRPVAVLFQDSNLFPHLTVTRNVALALDPRGRISADQVAQVAAMLGSVGLDGFGDRLPGQLSGGQQSRAALARVLLQDRAIVLLDEPFAALGPGLKDEMLRLAATRLRAAGRTILLVTHDPDEARAVADGIVLVSDGAVQGPLALGVLDDPPPALARYLGR